MASGAQKRSIDFRVPKRLPFELRQHCAIYFEEKLYSQALGLLLNLLTCGTTTHAPAFAPAPQHLALAATILVHPSTTTRAKSREEEDAASAALQLLRLTHHLVGPISARFDKAFTFKHFNISRHGGQWRGEEPGLLSSAAYGGYDDDETPLNVDLAKSNSVWSRAEDFWHAVGWAFNCSILYPRRWERWQIWLEFMCWAMEVDWLQREEMANNNNNNNNNNDDDDENNNTEQKGAKSLERIMMKSLLWKFISTGSAGFGQNRRILRAIFADGSPNSLAEFREVFKNELKDGKQDETISANARKRAEVNIDEDKYGDYLSGGDDDDSDAADNNNNNSKGTRSKRARRGTRVAKDDEFIDMEEAIEGAEKEEQQEEDEEKEEKKKKLANGAFSKDVIAGFGGFQSLALRERLLNLLTKASLRMPKAFMKLSDLYHLFVENIRHLPLPIFQAFVSPSILPWLTPDAKSTLCETLLWRMRESSGPNSSDPYLNQRKLQECYLPYAASTASAVDNAKVSILLESLIMLLAQSDSLRNTPVLREAVFTGNGRRISKAGAETRRNKASRDLEDEEWCWLVESADRLLYLVDEILPKEDLSDEE